VVPAVTGRPPSRGHVWLFAVAGLLTLAAIALLVTAVVDGDGNRYLTAAVGALTGLNFFVAGKKSLAKHHAGAPTPPEGPGRRAS
jgi:hypothetical protein